MVEAIKYFPVQFLKGKRDSQLLCGQNLVQKFLKKENKRSSSEVLLLGFFFVDFLYPST